MSHYVVEAQFERSTGKLLYIASCCCLWARHFTLTVLFQPQDVKLGTGELYAGGNTVN